MDVCDGSEVVVGARKNLPQIFVCEVDEKGSLRRRQVADDGEDKVKYIPGTTSTPNATRYPQTYGTFETQGGSYVPSPSSMDGNLPPMNPQNPQYLQVPLSPHHDSPPRKTMNPPNPQYLQVPLSPRHDSPPRKKSRDEYGLSFSSASIGDSGFHDDSLFRGHDSDVSYRGHDSDSSFRGYGKTSQIPPGLDESYSDGTSSRSWKRSHGLDGSVWSSISAPVEDLRRKMKGRASFTDQSVPWIDVSKQQVIQGVCVFVLVTSIAFGMVGFARHFQTSPLEDSFSHGKYRSIEMGAKMWRDKMAEEGRVLGANIVDEDGNVLLGGKRAAIQFAHDLNNKDDLNNKAEEVTFPEAEVAGKRQDSIDEGGLMKDSKEVVSRESRSPMKDNDEKDEVKYMKELTEEIRQISEMLKKSDSGLDDEKVQIDYDYDELVLRNQLEEKNRKKKQLVQKINDFGRFSSGRVAPLSPTSSNDDLFDGDDESDQDDIDGILEQDLNNAEDLDEIIEVNITPDSETEVSQFDSINENTEVADESVEDSFDQKKAEEQLKLLLDEVKVKTKKLEERKAMKIKKASKKKTKNKNPLKELANRSKKITKAVKSTAMKSKASDESSKVIDLNTDEDLSDAFEEKFKGDEVGKNRRYKE